MIQFSTFLGYLTVHTISLITVFSIQDIALSMAYFSLKYLKSELKAKIESQMAQTTKQPGFKQQYLLTPNTTKGDSLSQALVLVRSLCKAFKGHYFYDGDEKATVRQIIGIFRLEYLNYTNRVLGLKNLEKSFPQFFTEEAKAIIMRCQK